MSQKIHLNCVFAVFPKLSYVVILKNEIGENVPFISSEVLVSGRTFDPPQEFDDPNTTITNILDIVRQMGVSIDFAPSKLKQGFGEQAIFVLDRLSDETLR